MSVLIENMIIPSEGEYPITLYVCSDGTAYIDAWSLPQDCDKFPVVSIFTKHGKWVLKTFNDEYGDYQLYECNICGEVTAQRRNYCPFCGADMREKN